MPRTSPVDDFLTPFTITLAPGEQHVEMVGQNFLVDGPEFVHMKSQPNLLLRSFYSLTIHPGTPKEQHFTYPIVLSEQRLTESAPNLFNPGLDDSQLQYRATWNSEGENLFSQSLTRPFFLDRTSVYGHLGRIIITSPDTPSSDIFFSEAMLDDPTRSELFPCTEPTIIQNRSTQVP